MQLGPTSQAAISADVYRFVGNNLLAPGLFNKADCRLGGEFCCKFMITHFLCAIRISLV